MKKKVLEPKLLQYPTEIERSEAIENVPKVCDFNFKLIKELELLPANKTSQEETKKRYDLYCWNHCLKNRIGKLNESYIYTITSYNRGFDDDHFKNKENSEIVNQFLFEYYSEIYYYFFFSTIEVIAQIINIYYSIKIPEEKLHFNEKFFDEIGNEKVKTLLKDFKSSIKDASYYRNASTHRFTPTVKDFRETLKFEDGKTVLLLEGNSVASVEYVKNIKESFFTLSVLMEQLVKDIF